MSLRDKKGGNLMRRHLHLTKRQWCGILKWTLYALLALFTLITQGVLCAQFPLFGLKLRFLPILLVCIAIREGTEKGGLFCLIATTVMCLSKTDYGSLSVAVLTVLCILSAALCHSVLANCLWSVALCCFVTVFANETAILLFRSVLDRTAFSNLWRVALPSCLLSMLLCPLLYVTVRAIGKIGVDHGV